MSRLFEKLLITYELMLIIYDRIRWGRNLIKWVEY